jgi:hypothetical protein
MGVQAPSLIFPIRAPDGTRAMWWIVGFVLALALTIGGAMWLVFQLFIAEEFSRNLIAAAQQEQGERLQDQVSGEPKTDPCASFLSLPTLQLEQNCSRRLRSTARLVAVVGPTHLHWLMTAPLIVLLGTV